MAIPQDVHAVVVPLGEFFDVTHADIDVALLAPHFAPLVSGQLNGLRSLVDIEVVGHAQFAVCEIPGKGLQLRHVFVDELTRLD